MCYDKCISASFVPPVCFSVSFGGVESFKDIKTVVEKCYCVTRKKYDYLLPSHNRVEPLYTDYPFIFTRESINNFIPYPEIITLNNYVGYFNNKHRSNTSPRRMLDVSVFYRRKIFLSSNIEKKKILSLNWTIIQNEP